MHGDQGLIKGGSSMTRAERADEPKAIISNDSKDRESSARRRQARPQHDGEARGIPDVLCGMLTREDDDTLHDFEFLTQRSMPAYTAAFHTSLLRRSST